MIRRTIERSQCTAGTRISTCVDGVHGFGVENVKAAELVMAGEAADCLTDASAFDVGYPYSFMKNIQGRW